MGGGWDQIGEETEGLAAAFGGYHHHVAVVAGGAVHGHAGDRLVAVFDEGHAAGSQQGIVVGVDIGDAVANVALVGVLPFAAAGEILRAGEGGGGAVSGEHGVAAAMVPVQVAVDDAIDGLGVDAVPGDPLGQVVGDGREFGALAGARVHLIAAAGFDQDGVVARADDIAVEGERDAVEFVGRGLTAPEGFGDDAEHGAAIPPIDGIANQGQAEIAHLGVVEGQSGRQHSTFDELAAALEEVGGIIDKFAAAFEHVLADVGDVLAGGLDGFAALLGLVG